LVRIVVGSEIKSRMILIGLGVVVMMT